MNIADISKVLESIQLDIESIEDTNIKGLISILLNLVENLVSDNTELRQENQKLKDEINILKGEQGKPNIKSNKNKDGNISSEQERKEAESSEGENKSQECFKLDKGALTKLMEQRIPVEVLSQLEKLNGQKYPSEDDFVSAVESEIGNELTNQYICLLVKYARYKRRKRKPKLPEIKIDREEKCYVDAAQLPDDAEFKGYEDKVVQDLIIKTDNVKFRREIYYSASLKKTYLGEIPRGYEGDYGPHINSQIILMKYVNNMSIPKIEDFFKNVEIFISGSYISNRLTKCLEDFHREKSELYNASMESSSYQQIDDTTCRVNGKNHYTQIVCNPLCTLFFTTKRKDRLTILDVLRNFESRSFVFNKETFSLLEKLKISKKLIAMLHEVEKNRSFMSRRCRKYFKNFFLTLSKGKFIEQEF